MRMNDAPEKMPLALPVAEIQSAKSRQKKRRQIPEYTGDHLRPPTLPSFCANADPSHSTIGRGQHWQDYNMGGRRWNTKKYIGELEK